MKRSSQLAVAAGVILILMGSVWILQGLDVAFAPQSFMTDDHWWVVWGSLAAIGGLALVWRNIRNR